MPTRLIRSEYAVVSLFRAHSDSAFRVFPFNLAVSVRTTRTLSARKRRPTSLILSSWILLFWTHLSKVCDVIPSHFSAMAFGTIAQDFGLSSKFFLYSAAVNNIAFASISGTGAENAESPKPSWRSKLNRSKHVDPD